jgi:hypothetical protein
MSDVSKNRLQSAVHRLTITLGEIYTETAAMNDPRLTEVAATYRDTFASLVPNFDRWIVDIEPVHPLVVRLANTMDTVVELYQHRNFRGALQQTHAVFSALPGIPDFPPISIPPLPGSED